MEGDGARLRILDVLLIGINIFTLTKCKTQQTPKKKNISTWLGSALKVRDYIYIEWGCMTKSERWREQEILIFPLF